jgi:hypothetical protein
MNNEWKRMCKEAVVVQLSHYPDIILEDRNKTTKYLSQFCQSPDRDLDPTRIE